jgi:hypothetical protein
MDREGDRRRADSEPRGDLPRSGAAAARWRRVMNWLFGAREGIEQEGLLAERTLPIAPRPGGSEATGGEGEPPGATGDEKR